MREDTECVASSCPTLLVAGCSHGGSAASYLRWQNDREELEGQRLVEVVERESKSLPSN